MEPPAVTPVLALHHPKLHKLDGFQFSMMRKHQRLA